VGGGADNHLFLQFKIHIVTLAGERLGTFSPDPDPAFGVRHATWHPNGAYLAVGGWSDKIYILDSLTWSPAVVLEAAGRIPASAVIWREPSNWLGATYGRGFISYERVQGPITIPLHHIDVSRANRKSGVAQLTWNINGTLLLARFGQLPNHTHTHLLSFNHYLLRMRAHCCLSI